LYFAHPQDADASNNFVYFASLTGHDGTLVGRLAADNLARNPQNLTYLATRAFVLFMDGRPDDALALLKPKAAEKDRSSALAFAYGLALAGTGNMAEARELLGQLDPAMQSTREVELIKTALEPGQP
jgi:thioredoxin-like negative regulator of GroEL